MSSERTDASADWCTEYEETDVETSIDSPDICAYSGCDRADELERIRIIGGGRIRVEWGCPDHREDIMGVKIAG